MRYKWVSSIIVLITIIMMTFSISHAFEVDGFKTGMTVDESLSILASRGLKPTEIRGLSNQNETSYLASRPGGESIAITFCRGMLNSYQVDVLGGLTSFIKMVDKETLIKGKGTYVVRSEQTIVGEWNTIEFYWPSLKDKHEIGLSKVKNDSEQVYVRYSTLQQCK